MEYISHVTSSTNGELAEDAAQEVFILLYYNVKNLKEPAVFITWLRKIVFSCCTRIIRGKKDEVHYSEYE